MLPSNCDRICTTYIKANETQTSCELSQFCKREWTFISLILSWFWRKVVVINVFPKVSNAYPAKIRKIWTSLVTPQWPSFSGLGFWGPRGLYPPSHKPLTSFQINDVKFLGKWIIIVSIVIYVMYLFSMIYGFHCYQRFVSSTGNMEVLLSHTHSIVCACM